MVEETMVVSVREFVFVIVGSVVVSLAVLAALWPWVRQVRRLVVIGLAAAFGIVVWNLALNVTKATALNVDSPFLGLSAQDVGSGVLAFIATALALGLIERGRARAPCPRRLGHRRRGDDDRRSVRLTRSSRGCAISE
jgi:hypothetical protein